MNREIKFRDWDKDNKRMINITSINDELYELLLRAKKEGYNYLLIIGHEITNDTFVQKYKVAHHISELGNYNGFLYELDKIMVLKNE